MDELEFKTEVETQSLVVEIFAVGKWNNYKFSEKDLHEIAANFNKFKEFHRVPLKFGHNDEQPMTDGFPALGWVQDVWVDTGKDGKPKLFGRFTQIPKIVFEAIEKNLYKHVSIELDANVQHKGKSYKYVLSGVALLGADLPAVNTIADLKTYMSRDISALEIEFSRRKSFTLNQLSEDSTMDELEKMKAELDRLKAEKASLEQEKLSFSAKAEALEAEARRAKVDAARKAVNGVLDNAVRESRLTPAKREAFSKLLGVNDDAKVVEIDLKEVEQLCDSEVAASMESKSFGREQEKYDDDKTAGEILHEKTEELMLEKGISYRQAQDIVFRRNVKLAKAHIDAA